MSLQAGLAAACRSNATAIKAAGFDTVENDYPGCLYGDGVKLKYDTNYFHFHPDHWTLPQRLLQELKRYRRNIAYWAWETDRAPDLYREASKTLDAVWVPSTYVREALGEMHCPVHIVPHAVPTTSQNAPRRGRPGKFRVLFAFDGKSRIARKNPFGAIRAFQLAFPRMDEVELVIKAHALPVEIRDAIKTLAAADPRISLLEGWAPVEQVEQIYRKSQVFLGLQRSEGFGLHLAEAMAHGCVVITTGYGGHVDFIKDQDNGYLVPFKKVKITDQYYQGSEWAEPDIHAAAERLAWVHDMYDGPLMEQLRRRAWQTVKDQLSPQALVDRVKDLLEPQ